MATLTRFDEAFDDLLRGFFVRPVSFEGSHGQAAAAQFRVEVSENEQAYVIRAEIPGVKKDDINISIDGDQVATVNVATDPFPASTSGDSHIKDSVELPSPCVAPIVFVGPNPATWFAATGQ